MMKVTRQETAFPADVWAAEQVALLRGIAHALSNRVGTIVSAVGMLTPGAPVAAPIVAVLADEGTRLEELLALVRVLAADADGSAPEPVHVPDLVRPLIALHAQHPEVRDVEVEIDETPIEVPALVAPGPVSRGLLVLLTAAKRGGAPVRIAWHAAPDAVVVSVGAPATDAGTAAAAQGVVGDAGRVRVSDAGYEVAMPRLG